MVQIILYFILVIAVIIAIIFHELGHYIVGMVYHLEPKFGIMKIYGIPHPAVFIGEGKKLPNKWSLLAGFVFSLAGFPIFYIILTQVLIVNKILLLYFYSSAYIFFCVTALGFIKSRTGITLEISLN